MVLVFCQVVYRDRQFIITRDGSSPAYSLIDVDIRRIPIILIVCHVHATGPPVKDPGEFPVYDVKQAIKGWFLHGAFCPNGLVRSTR